MEHATLLRTSDAARRLGISRTWLVRLIDAGRVPAVRTADGTRLVAADAVERLARERADAREGVRS